MAETPIVNFRLASEDIATLDLLVEEARRVAPAEIAIAVSRTSVLRRWLARERERLATESTGEHAVIDAACACGLGDAAGKVM